MQRKQILSNLETHNAQMIREGRNKTERFQILKDIAEYQLNILIAAENIRYDAYEPIDVDDTMLRVTNAIRDAVRPDITMFVECRNDVMDEKSIVCVTVQRGIARPYYLYRKGIRPEGVYVRRGASTVPATDAVILNMIKETGGDSYETARSLDQNLTFNKSAGFFAV